VALCLEIHYSTGTLIYLHMIRDFFRESSNFSETTLSRSYRLKDPGEGSRYSDWLRAGRPRGRSWSPGTGMVLSSSRQDQLCDPPSLLSMQWVPGELSPTEKRLGMKLTTPRRDS
jgi:hypothetical protein